MTNPVKALEDFFGTRPKGRRLSLKEQFQIYSVESLKKPVLATAAKYASIPIFSTAIGELIQGNDMPFSHVLIGFGIMLIINVAGMRMLQATERKNKAAGTY